MTAKPFEVCSLAEPLHASGPTVVCVGNFDGVHRAHACMISKAAELARELRADCMAVTFDPHPVSLLRPAQIPPPLSTVPDRAAWLQDAGADQVTVLRPDPSFLQLSAEEFFEEFLIRQFGAVGVVEGPNFRFGHGRHGDCRRLRELCADKGIACRIIDAVEIDGAMISSTRIRTLIEAGRIQAASELLGRPYRLTGKVVHGAGRGRTLGFPTANLDGIETLLPPPAVYAAQCVIEDTAHAAALNIGPNPTFGDHRMKVELSICDFHGDLYGRRLAVDVLAELRELRSFDGADELVTQIHHDIDRCRSVFDEFTGKGDTG